MDRSSRREFLRVAGVGAAGALAAGGCRSGGARVWGQLPENELELRIDGGVEVINLQDLVNGIDWIADKFAGRTCIDLDLAADVQVLLQEGDGLVELREKVVPDISSVGDEV